VKSNTKVDLVWTDRVPATRATIDGPAWVIQLFGKTPNGRECVEHALEVRGVSRRFGGVRAHTEVSFGVNDGEAIADERKPG
jgi:hypothetical protein